MGDKLNLGASQGTDTQVFRIHFTRPGEKHKPGFIDIYNSFKIGAWFLNWVRAKQLHNVQHIAIQHIFMHWINELTFVLVPIVLEDLKAIDIQQSYDWWWALTAVVHIILQIDSTQYTQFWR